MGRVCYVPSLYVPSLYVPSLYGPSLLCAEFVMGRICYVPCWPDTPDHALLAVASKTKNRVFWIWLPIFNLFHFSFLIRRQKDRDIVPNNANKKRNDDNRQENPQPDVGVQ